MKLAFIGLGRMGLKSVADYGIGKEIIRKRNLCCIRMRKEAKGRKSWKRGAGRRR